MGRVQPQGVTLDGLDLSGVDADGVEWHVSKVTGWTGSPASTTSSTQRAGQHGTRSTIRPRFTGRSIAIEGTITGDPRLVSLAADRLNTACDLDDVRLVVDETARSRWAMVHRTDEVLIDDTLAHHYAYSIQLGADDPRKYGDAIELSTGLPVTTGGLAVPLSVPFGIDSQVKSGQVSVENLGNIEAPVRIRIDGPVTGPVITHVGTGRALVFSTSLTLARGEWLDVDMENRRALLNGTASRAARIVQREWSTFQPGPNTWTFSAPQPSPDARVTVYVASAWR